MNDKILILGKGFIGSRLQEEFGCDISDRKIYTLKDAEEEIKRFSPRIIINCIGHVGKNVDECEKDLDKTLMSNTFVPIILAELALRHKIKLVHISSGCIYHFDYLQDDPINEDKIPDYLDLFYSRAKIYSEEALKILAKEYPILIARLRLPLDNRPHPRNLLTKLVEYKRIIDIPNSVTYIPDFILSLKHLMKINATGIYNVVNKGALKFTDLLVVYQKYFPKFQYQVIDFRELNLKRTNLILSTGKLEQSGFKIRNIKEVLEECVQEYIRHL